MLPTDARQYTHKLNLGGRDFELILSPAPGSFALDEGYEAWLPLAIGLAFTSLFTAYLVLMHLRSRELLAGQQACEQQFNERINAQQKLREANQSLEELSRKDPVIVNLPDSVPPASWEAFKANSLGVRIFSDSPAAPRYDPRYAPPEHRAVDATLYRAKQQG